MTKPKRNDTLYIHLMSVINEALPMEYAIRAARQANPHELAQLSEIDLRIRQHWINLGASEAEIDSESLMDFAWDTIQVGFPLTRRHGRLYPNREFRDLIDRGLADVRGTFGTEVGQLNIPAARYFRICDLLTGNDVLGLLNTTARCLGDSKGYEAARDIELKKFVLGVRGPIHLHPGLRYVVSNRREEERTIESFGIVLDTKMEFSMPDLKRQIREFLYQFAVRRESMRPPHVVDRISHELIDEFLRNELLGRIEERKVARLDGFISSLSGLYCWDLVQQYRLEGRKSPVNSAVVGTQAIYPKNIREVGDHAIEKNYKTARVTIDKMSFGTAVPKKLRRGNKRRPS